MNLNPCQATKSWHWFVLECQSFYSQLNITNYSINTRRSWIKNEIPEIQFQKWRLMKEIIFIETYWFEIFNFWINARYCKFDMQASKLQTFKMQPVISFQWPKWKFRWESSKSLRRTHVVSGSSGTLLTSSSRNLRECSDDSMVNFLVVHKGYLCFLYLKIMFLKLLSMVMQYFKFQYAPHSWVLKTKNSLFIRK